MNLSLQKLLSLKIRPFIKFVYHENFEPYGTYVCMQNKPMSYIEWNELSKPPYNGFISLGANFPEWSALSFSRNFPDLEIHDPNNQKTQVSYISESHKVYVCT